MANRWICLNDEEISFLTAAINPLPENKFPEKKRILSKFSKTQKRISVQSAKGKGRELQKWVCERISALTGIPYNQQDDNCLIHSREMGQQGVDIILRGNAHEQFPFAVECKSTESMSMTAYIKQAQANEKQGIDWLVVYRSKVIKNPVAIMAWDTLEKLWRAGNK